MSDARLNGPHPAPSEAQLDAGVDKDWHLRTLEAEGAQPEMSDDQRNTAIDGNAPHTQPEGEFTGSQYPVDADRPNEIEPASERMGVVASVEDLDEQGRPVDGKTGRGVARHDTLATTPAAQGRGSADEQREAKGKVVEGTPAAAGGESPAAKAEAKNAKDSRKS